jgi:DNA-binding transcriptional regulator LsrR (DeoR family)
MGIAMWLTIVMALKRRAKREVTRDEMVQMALARYAASRSTGGFRTLKDVSSEFGRDQATVSRSIARAFREGLVQVKRSGAMPYERAARLEERLEQTFPKTRAIVVDWHRVPGSSAGPEQEDDELHECVGAALAGAIAQQGIFRDGDAVGVGGGRAVYYTADALRQATGDKPLPVANIPVVAIAGSLFPQDLSGRLHAKLDADLNVNVLAPCFEGGKPRTLAVPLSYRAKERVRLALEDWDATHKQRQSVLTHALVGLGVLSERHRMLQLMKLSARDEMFGGIQRLLADLVRISDKHRNAENDYYPLAEVCCRLFVVEPDRLPDKDLRKISTFIQELDERILTIERTVLYGISRLLLVAAGRGKGRAIRQLLRAGDWRVRYVCTDVSAATQILES